MQWNINKKNPKIFIEEIIFENVLCKMISTLFSQAAMCQIATELFSNYALTNVLPEFATMKIDGPYWW